MAFTVRTVEYFHTTVRDEPGEAFKVLSDIAARGVDLVAFTTVPIGPASAQLTIFPDDSRHLRTETLKTGIVLEGPQRALLVQGDDELGVLARIHGKLSDASVNVFASQGIAVGKGTFGYLIYVRPDDFEKASRALEIESPSRAPH